MNRSISLFFIVCGLMAQGLWASQETKEKKQRHADLNAEQLKHFVSRLPKDLKRELLFEYVGIDALFGDDFIEHAWYHKACVQTEVAKLPGVLLDNKALIDRLRKRMQKCMTIQEVARLLRVTNYCRKKLPESESPGMALSGVKPQFTFGHKGYELFFDGVPRLCRAFFCTNVRVTLAQSAKRRKTATGVASVVEISGPQLLQELVDKEIEAQLKLKASTTLSSSISISSQPTLSGQLSGNTLALLASMTSSAPPSTSALVLPPPTDFYGASHE